jgi:hypothetical protein
MTTTNGKPVFTGTIKTVKVDLEPQRPKSATEKAENEKARRQTMVVSGVHG